MWDLSPLFSEVVEHYDSFNHITCAFGQANIGSMDVPKTTTLYEHMIFMIGWHTLISSSWFYYLKNIYLLKKILDKE